MNIFGRLGIFVVIVIVPLLAATRCVAPDAGYEAVLIEKPLIFGHGGVVSEPVTTGREFIFWTTKAVTVDMRPQRIDLEFDDLMTSSGVPIDFHAVLTYQVKDSVVLVSDFGAEYNEAGTPQFFTRNLEQPFRTAVRDAVKKRDMNEMAITVTAAEEVDKEVTEHLVSIIEATGVPINLVDLSLGRANPPDAVKNQRIQTAEQEQRAITEQQRKLAEDQRRAAEEARAASDNAYREAMKLSPDQFLQLEQIKMLREVCKDGKCTFIQGDSAVPVLNLNK